MPELKRRGKEKKDSRPIVVDDFIYNDPEENVPVDYVSSDTPDEAVRKLQDSRNDASSVSAGIPDSAESAAEEYLGRKDPSAQPWVSSSGVILDGKKRQPVDTRGHRPRKEHRGLRAFALTVVTVVLILFIAAYIFHRIDENIPFLDKPEILISRLVSPVQSFFSRVTDTAVGYIRSWQTGDELADKYADAIALNEQLTYKKMLSDELKGELGQYTVLSDEVRNIENLRPITCKITGRSDTNYFSTFTIDKGSADGILREMPVTYGLSLVGYIDSVDRYRSVVRTVIDSNVSIGVVIQSNSRDQGTLNGTVGIDGAPMCRVHLVEKSELPRPGDQVVTSGVGMDFLDGIPIGVITESTRGSKDNRDYIVVKPNVDFAALDHVVVLRYKTAESISNPLVPEDVSAPEDSGETSDDESGSENEPTDEYDLSYDFGFDDIEMMDYNDYSDNPEAETSGGNTGDADGMDDVTFVEITDDEPSDEAGPEGGDADADYEEAW